MKLAYVGSLSLCVAIVLAAGPVLAEGWALPKLASFSGGSTKKSSSTSKALKQLDRGTKKFVRGTVDVITLKPLWKKKPEPPTKPWLNHTRKSSPKKKSVWQSWFGPKEPTQPQTMKDFVGMKRPS